MNYLMGIDIGSTKTKCVIFSADGQVVSAGEADTVLSYDKQNPAWSFWDYEELWNNTVQAIRQAMSGVPDPESVRAVTATSFSSDVALLDENGESLYHIKSWHCPRVQHIMDRWISEIGALSIFLRTGRQPTKMDTIYYLNWLSENKEDICARTKTILFVSDYINYKLTGRAMTDYSMANTSSAFDQHEKRWIGEYLERAGFGVSKMPAVGQSGTLVGHVSAKAAGETGLSEKTSVILGGHDNECAALSAGVVSNDSIVDIVGTWEIVLTSSDMLNLTTQKFSCGLTENFHVIGDRFVTIGYEVSGFLLEWAKTNLFGAEEDALTEGGSIWNHIISRISDIPAGSRGIVVLPYITGRSCIFPNSASSCTILGLKGFHDKNDIMHAVLEGICFQTRELVESMERAKGQTYSEITCVGGPTKNHLLMQMKADICGKRIKAMELEHGTALGAAMIAGTGSEIYESISGALQKIQKNQTYRIYEPTKDSKAVYDELFDYYQKAYQAIEGIR